MANVGEIVGYAGTGAIIGSAFGPIGTGIGAGVGALSGGLKGWYDRWQGGKQNRWQENELLRKYLAIDRAGALETASTQDAINRQLAISQQNLASTFAVSGGIRTGNYQRKVGELNRYATEDVARIAQQKALEVEGMKMGYGASVNQFNLELAKLESAKASGDSAMAMSAGENVVKPLLDYIMGLNKQDGGEGSVTNAGWQSPLEQGGLEQNPDPYWYQAPPSQTYGNSPTFDYLKSLKPRLRSGVVQPPEVDNSQSPIDVLFGG